MQNMLEWREAAIGWERRMERKVKSVDMSKDKLKRFKY